MSCWSSIEGTWSYWDMIGAKFRITSLSLSKGGILSKCRDISKYTQRDLILKEIHFKSSTDGKVIPLFEMEGICETLFVPRDLELVEMNPLSNIPAICGKVICGKIRVGNKISGIHGIQESEIIE